MATRSQSDPGGIADVLVVLGRDVQPLKARKPSCLKVPAPGVPQREPGVGLVARAAGSGAVVG